MCVVNMKLCRDVLVQQVFKKIRNIQDINSFKCTRKIFDIGAIVIPSHEHIILVHYIINSDI